jgi:hypothetical protein
MKSAFDKIKAGLEDAIAYSEPEEFWTDVTSIGSAYFVEASNGGRCPHRRPAEA